MRALVCSAALSWLAIMVIRAASVRLADENIFKKRVLVYGCGKAAQIVANLRRKADRRGFIVTGYVPADGEPELVPADMIEVYENYMQIGRMDALNLSLSS